MTLGKVHLKEYFSYYIIFSYNKKNIDSNENNDAIIDILKEENMYPQSINKLDSFDQKPASKSQIYLGEKKKMHDNCTMLKILISHK